MTSSDSFAPLDRALLQETVDDLYEHAPCGYLSTVPDGRIVKVNQTFLDWTGRTRAELLGGVRFQGLLTIGGQIYYETHYAPLLQMQGFAKELALELVCADGRVLPVLINASQRRDANGVVLFNRITLFDATDRRRYERELLLARRKAEQVAKDKADLLAMLSHDIRNPLNALMGVVDLLAMTELTDQQQRLVRILKSSSESMLSLLRQVLELSRAESGSFTLTETPFSLKELIGGVVATFEARAEAKGLQVEISLDESVPPQILGDPVALRQIIANLVDNAIKFTEHGSIAITVVTKERAADSVTLEVAVADSGVGIPAEMVERIFNEFTQASYETAMRFGGTGLGLSITRKLLSMYGSHVDVVSTPGEGSTFSFRIRLSLPR